MSEKRKPKFWIERLVDQLQPPKPLGDGVYRYGRIWPPKVEPDYVVVIKGEP